MLILLSILLSRSSMVDEAYVLPNRYLARRAGFSLAISPSLPPSRSPAGAYPAGGALRLCWSLVAVYNATIQYRPTLDNRYGGPLLEAFDNVGWE